MHILAVNMKDGHPFGMTCPLKTLRIFICCLLVLLILVSYFFTLYRSLSFFGHISLCMNGVRLSNALFLITSFLDMRLWQEWQLLRLRSHIQRFLCISLFNRKLNSLISMLPNGDMCVVWNGLKWIIWGPLLSMQLFLLFSDNFNVDPTWNIVPSHSRGQGFVFEVNFEIPLQKNT